MFHFFGLRMQKFSETGLSGSILKALDEIGFYTPTPIQSQTISHLLTTNSDLVALAQTGTGKTAAFGLPLIDKINVESRNIQALVLCPTRELCIQITNDFIKYSKYIENLKITAVYGGANIQAQISSLNKGTHIVVGTPGRVIDLINRGKLKFHSIETLVLDEGDEMLNMGFKEELDQILAVMPREKRTLLFSATMPPEMLKISQKYIKDYVEITVGKKNEGAALVEHFYYFVNSKDKYLALKRIADYFPDIYSIVFCRTREETKQIADKLIQDGYNADALHGDLSQVQRDVVMNRFRGKHLQMLVATDVAARGLDVSDVTHVINYSIPEEAEAYLHRSGRTGRAGKAGISISIIHSKQLRFIRDLEKSVGKKFERALVPSGKQICEAQLLKLIDEMQNVAVNEDMIEPLMLPIYKKLAWLSREELIKKFVSVEFNRFLEYYRNAQDINLEERPISRRDRPETGSGRSRSDDRRGSKQYDGNDRSDRGDRGDRGDRNSRDDRDGRRRKTSPDERRSKTQFVKLYLSGGENIDLNKRSLMDLINKNKDLKGVEIGKIVIDRKSSTIEIDSKYIVKAIGLLDGLNFKGKRISVEPAR